MLDPQTLRKPGCRGLPVVMADDQEWLVRRPRALFTPDDGEDGLSADCFDLGPEYDALFARLTAATDRIGELRALMGLYRHLLVVNYDLDTAALKRLIRLDFAAAPEGEPEPDGVRLARELEDIVLGRTEAPKATVAGSTSP